MKNYRIVFVFILVVLMSPFSALAVDKISVAVAANFISAFKDLAADFEAKTKVKVEGTFSSTGNLYTQITNGAPYDLFLSADEERPARLYKDGVAEKPFVYASGHVILWSDHKDFCKVAAWQEALKNEQGKKDRDSQSPDCPLRSGSQRCPAKNKVVGSITDQVG